jgi:hypothetical protein
MRLHPMQENIGLPLYQMSLSVAQYRIWPISSGDRSTRLRMSFLPRALQGVKGKRNDSRRWFARLPFLQRQLAS